MLVLNSVLKQFALNADLQDADRDTITAFLAEDDDSAASGQILGILKQMQDTMTASLGDATASENDSIKTFDELVASKNKEIDALTKSIEEKMTRIGEIAVKVAEMGNELEDTKEDLEESKKFLAELDVNCENKKKEWAAYQKMQDLEESKKFLAELDVNCENKKKEWAAYQKMQGEELLALADTIKVLNDDDALELFKKTLPGSSASFMQVTVSSKAMQQKALAILAQVNSPRVDLLEVALRGGKQGFGKIIKMIDNLTAELKKAQADDDDKKSYCESELDKAEDKKKGLAQDVSDLETAIDDETEAIGTLKTEIEALDDGIRALDKEVATATENRQAEHEEFKATYASNTAAVDLLKFAKNRLNKFYNPSLAKFVQTAAAPPAAPEAPADYEKKTEAGNSIIAMLDELAADLDKEMTVAQAEEKDAQAAYQRATSDAKDKRAQDTKMITDKKGVTADTEAALQTASDDKASAEKELAATNSAIQALHGECDWILKYYELRKESRAGEIDALGKAKAVLNGADFSLVQIHSKSLRGA